MTHMQLTKQAEAALSAASAIAKTMGQPYVGSEHLLLGLLKTPCIISELLPRNGVTAEKLVEMIHKLITLDQGAAPAEHIGPETEWEPARTPRLERILEGAQEDAGIGGMEKVGTEHLFLSMLRQGDCVATRLLTTLKVNESKILLEMFQAMGEDGAAYIRKMQAGPEGENDSMLDRFSRDLTAMARDGKLDPVIGRRKELERLIRTLSRRTKNNPCLIGEPGVGKTSIVELLAREIAAEHVPDSIRGKRLLSLDLAGMVAGTKFRGEFEERIKGLIREASEDDRIILFLDEIHTLIGAGGAEGALDAANILKPALSRGEIQLIGATTVEEYRKHIEKDAALERRFQPLMVEEPSEAESIEILKGLRSRFEAHHRVTISDGACEAAVTLSARYCSDRFLPDKAIDILDESAAKVQLVSAGRRSKSVVTENEVAGVVADLTGIPVSRLNEREADRLSHLEKTLHKRLVGQEEAVSAVARAVRRGRTGLKDPGRPIGSFLFLGPTGVGKTELAKALTEALFGKEESMIRVDMSEFMEQHSVSKLIGSPPGYVGYDAGGQFSEKVRRNPYSVVLFDEIEKAHPDIFHLLLQILDDGHITDAQGRKVSFKNTIIIMTSNAGANRIVSPKKLGFSAGNDPKADYETMKAGVMEEVKHTFRPEFLNRIDETIVFSQLSKPELEAILKNLLGKLEKRLQQSRGVKLKVSAAACEYLIQKGTDSKYGARPLRRALQTELEDPIAMELLSGSVKPGAVLRVGVSDGKLKFKAEGEKQE